MTESDPRLKAFREMSPDTKWDDRLDSIKKVFPSVERLDWTKAFNQDIDLLGRILKDVLKADQAVPGRPGPRPGLDRAHSEPRLDEWMGRDPTERPYTNLPFHEAFRLLARGKSITQTARKTNQSRTQTFRLMGGLVKPDMEIIQTVAAAYGKEPSYFLEYRVAAIAAHVMYGLEESPDHSIHYFEALYH